MTTQEIWQAQALDAPRISLAYLRHQMDSLRRRTQVRSGLKYAGDFCAVVFLVVVGWSFFAPRPLTSFSVALWALGVFGVNFQRHRRMAMSATPEQMGALDALQFYRQQLVRQRDARRGNWRWWLPPIIPGMVSLPVALALESSKSWMDIGGLVVWFVFGVSMGIVLNERAARSIQDEIDALDSMGKQGT